MKEIKTPPFDSPNWRSRFKRGNNKCDCSCSATSLPRNAIMIRLKPGVPEEVTTELTKKVYDLVTDMWKGGLFARESQGSCQDFITIARLKEMDPFKRIGKSITISTIDNLDNKSLRKGDILLSRIGSKKSIGKPFIIKEEL